MGKQRSPKILDLVGTAFGRETYHHASQFQGLKVCLDMDDTEVRYHLTAIENVIRRKFETELAEVRAENEALKKRIAQLEMGFSEQCIADTLTQTQETVANDLEGDTTEVSPLKPVGRQLLDVGGSVKRTLFDDALTVKRLKKDAADDEIENEQQWKESEFLNSSQLLTEKFEEDGCDVPDSQGVEVESTTVDTSLVNLTQHPRYNRPWYPEDFVRHPLVAAHVGDRSVPLSQLPIQIQDYYVRQGAHLKALQSSKLSDVHPESVSLATTQRQGSEIVQPSIDFNLETAYTDARISNIYKFEINAENLDLYLRYYPNLLKTVKVRQWDIPDESADASDDFMQTQYVKERNAIKREESRKRALLMLFHSVFLVDGSGEQVGSWIFKDNQLNESVRTGKAVIDLSVFR